MSKRFLTTERQFALIEAAKERWSENQYGVVSRYPTPRIKIELEALHFLISGVIQETERLLNEGEHNV